MRKSKFSASNPPPEMVELNTQFNDYAKVEGKPSSYKTAVRGFLAWCSAEGIMQPERADADEYSNVLMQKNVGTAKNYSSGLNCFIKWLEARSSETVSSEILAPIAEPEPAVSEPTVVPVPNTQSLLEAVLQNAEEEKRPVKNSRSKRVQLLMQPSLYTEVKDLADEMGLSFNSFVHSYLKILVENNNIKLKGD